MTETLPTTAAPLGLVVLDTGMSAFPITSKDELIRHMFELLDENDAVEWPNDSAYTFLQAMAGWLESARARGVDTSQPSWQLFADMLDNARGLER